MSKPTKFKPIKTRSGWQLNIPSKYSVTGKRERHFFKTQVLALEASAKLKKDREAFGANARTITPSLAEQAVAAAGLLEPWGVSLIDAAREVAEARRVAAMSSPVNDACDLWLASCDGLRTKTLKGYRGAAKKLKEAFPDRQLSSLTSRELQLALAPAGTYGAHAAGIVRAAKSLWLWSAKQGWCRKETFAVEVDKNTDNGEIVFLSVEEAEALLRAAEVHYPQAVGHYAVQLFAGIRAAEVARLDPADVSPDGIELKGEVAKKGQRRHITPNACLRAWLEAHPFQSMSNWPRTDKAVRRLAGWQLESSLLTDPPAPTRGLWPQNALRHSHASYAVAAGVPLESLLFEFGHTGTPALIRKHYVGRASKKEAVAFFKIAPEGVEIPNLAIA